MGFGTKRISLTGSRPSGGAKRPSNFSAKATSKASDAAGLINSTALVRNSCGLQTTAWPMPGGGICPGISGMPGMPARSAGDSFCSTGRTLSASVNTRISRASLSGPGCKINAFSAASTAARSFSVTNLPQMISSNVRLASALPLLPNAKTIASINLETLPPA